MSKLFQTRRSQFLLLIFILVVTFSASFFLKIDYYQVKELMASMPLVVSGFVFVVAYVFLTFLIWIAKDILKIVGAVLFGAYTSTALIYAAEIINVFILFHLSRRLGRAFIIEKFKITEEQIDYAQKHTHFVRMFILRIVPLVPFRFLDLAYGLTAVDFHKYLTVSTIASPLRIFWIQFVLAAVGESMLKGGINEMMPILMQYFENNTVVFKWSFIYILVAFASVLVLKFTSKK